MRRFIILILLLSSVIIPALFEDAVAEKPQDLLKIGREGGASILLEPVKKVLSGSSALVVEGKDYRMGSKKDDALQSFQAEGRTPRLQAAAAALVPFRSPTAKFSRNLLITRDLGTFPFQTEPHMAVNPKNPEHIVVGVIDYNAPNVVSYVSIDRGATWEGPFQPKYVEYDLGAGGDPVVAFDRNGKTYMASISIGFQEFSILGTPSSETVSSIAVSTSEDGGFSWSRPISSSRSKIDLRLTAPGGSGVIGTIASGFLDKPWMTVGPNPKNPDKDVIYVTYTHFIVRYEIVGILGGEFFTLQNPVVESTIELVISEDEGQTWRSPIAVSPTVRKVYTPVSVQQFGQVARVVQGSQPLVTKDGALYVAWVDSTDDEAFKGTAEILVARSDDAGRSFRKSVVAASFLEPDYTSRTAFFRSWGSAFPQTASGPAGDISIVFTARPFGKPNDDGDVYYIRSEDGGSTWTRPKRLNDDETDRFQFFPAVAVDPKGVVHAMWGDFRDDKSEKRYNIYYTKSEDGGKTWIENSRVTDFPSNPNMAFPNGLFIGDYFAIKATEEEVYMVWADGRLGEFGVPDQKIAFARVSPIKSSSIFLSPPRGAGGKDVVIQGFNFQPDTEIFIEVSGVVVSGFRTDLDGKFTMRTFLPISGEGAHDVRVFDASGNVATTSFYMEFGFDTIEKRFQATLKDIQDRLLGIQRPANMSGVQLGNITGVQDTILMRVGSMQDILADRIADLEGSVGGRIDSMTTQIWIVGAVATVAIIASVSSLVLARRPRGP